MRKLCAPVAICMCIANLIAPAAANAAPPGFDDAVKSYNARQFSVALSKFCQVARANPNDVLTHYYMGLCYQQTNQFSMAKAQYEWVQTASRDNGIRNSCAQALAQLGRYQSQKVSGSGPIPSFSGSSGGGAPTGAPVRVSGRLRVIEFYTDW